MKTGWSVERRIEELEAAGFKLFFFARREKGFAIARGTVRAEVVTGEVHEVAEWDVRLAMRKRPGSAQVATRRALLGPDELKALRDHIDAELAADLPRTFDP